MNKISYKTYLNDRLKEVDFHHQQTHPLYVQLTFERKTIFFKSYYFELFSKPHYFLIVPGAGSKGPSLEDVIAKENELIDFIIDKYRDEFSLEVFKKAYNFYSKDICDLTEPGFIQYLYTFFWDKGSPHLGDLVKWGGKHIRAYDLVRDFKRTFNKPLYEEIIENSFYYSPPYLPIYGFMETNKRWPMLIFSVMEWDAPGIRDQFKKYVRLYYPNFNADEVVAEIDKHCGFEVRK